MNNEPSLLVFTHMDELDIQVTVKTDKPIFSAIPLITGVGEKELVEKIIVKVREIQEEKNND